METSYYFYASDPDAINHKFFETGYEYQSYLDSLTGSGEETDEDTGDEETPDEETGDDET